MRLPAVAIAAAFSCGIALGLHPAVARNPASLLLLSSSFVTIAVLVLTGFLFITIGRLLLAASASLLTWVVRGWKALASLHVQEWQPRQHQRWRRRQITNKTTRRNKKPTAACHS